MSAMPASTAASKHGAASPIGAESKRRHVRSKWVKRMRVRKTMVFDFRRMEIMRDRCRSATVITTMLPSRSGMNPI